MSAWIEALVPGDLVFVINPSLATCDNYKRASVTRVLSAYVETSDGRKWRKRDGIERGAEGWNKSRLANAQDADEVQRAQTSFRRQEVARLSTDARQKVEMLSRRKDVDPMVWASILVALNTALADATPTP